MATVDAHLFLPNWLVNWVIANVAYLILPMLYKQSRHYAPGGKLHDRITSKPAVYGEIRKRLARLDEAAAHRRTAAAANHESSTAAAAKAVATMAADAAEGGDAPSAARSGRVRGKARGPSAKRNATGATAPAKLRPRPWAWPLWAAACAAAAAVTARAVDRGQLARSGAGLGVCFATSSALLGPGAAAAMHCAGLLATASLGS